MAHLIDGSILLGWSTDRSCWLLLLLLDRMLDWPLVGPSVLGHSSTGRRYSGAKVCIQSAHQVWPGGRHNGGGHECMHTLPSPLPFDD